MIYRIISSLLCLFLPMFLEGQIILNEVYPNPNGGNTSPPQSIDEGDEWVELFNASCEDVDIGGWYIATQVLAATGIEEGGGVIELAAGTIVPALGTLAIGRNHTMGNVVCRIPKFVMANEEGWVGVYDNLEKPVDAIFWSPNVGNIASPRYSLSPCNGSGSINLPTAQSFQAMGKMRYVGQDPKEGTIFRRMPDGKDWESIQGGATPNQCNTGLCEEVPQTKIIAPKMELCSGEVMELSADQPEPMLTYNWSLGTPTMGTKTEVLFTNNTKVDITNQVNLSVKSISGFCEISDSIDITVVPIKSITKVSGPNTGCSLNFSDYTVDLLDADNYTWNIEGGSVASGQGTADATVSWGNTTNIGRVCVTAFGQCVSTSPVCKSVNLLPQRNLDSIIGKKQVCTNSINDYTIPAFLNATAFNWTATNGTFIGPKNTAIAKVKWLQGGGRLCATIQSACADPVPYCIDVTTTDSIRAAPIIGDSSICFNEIKNFSALMPITVLKTKWSYLDSVFSFIGRKDNIELTLIKSGNIELQIFGECIDTSVQRLNVKVFSKPTVNYALDGQPCVGDTLTYNFVSSEDFNLSFYAIKGRILETSNRILKVVYYNEASDVIKILHSRNGTQSLLCDKDTLFIPVTIKQCNICDDSTKAKFTYPDTTFCFFDQPIFPSALLGSVIGKLSSPSLGDLLDTLTGKIDLKDASGGIHKIYNTYTPSNPLCPIVQDSVVIRNVNEKFKVGYNPASCEGITPIELSGADTFYIGSIKTLPNFFLSYSKDTIVSFRGVISKCSTELNISLKIDLPLPPIQDIVVPLCKDSLFGKTTLLLDTLLANRNITGAIINLEDNAFFTKNNVHVDSFMMNELKLGIIRSTNNTCPSDTVKLTFIKTNCNPCIVQPESGKFRYDSLYCNATNLIKPVILAGSIGGIFTSSDIVNLAFDGTIDLSKLASGSYKIYNTILPQVIQCPVIVDSFIFRKVDFIPIIQYDSTICLGSIVSVKLTGGDSYKINNQLIDSTFQFSISKDTSFTVFSYKSGCELSKNISISVKNCAQDTCLFQDSISDISISDFGKCVNDTVTIRAIGSIKSGGIYSFINSPSFQKIKEDSLSITFSVATPGLFRIAYKTNDIDAGGPCRSVMDTVEFNIFTTPPKPNVINYNICTNGVILIKQNQNITWQNLANSNRFMNDTLRNLPLGQNRYAATSNINGCTSDTSQFIVKVNSVPNRLFSLDTFPIAKCINERDSIQLNFDSNLYRLDFTSNVTRENGNQFFFQNNGKLAWNIVDKASGCERMDSVIYRKKPLNPMELEVKNPLCNGQNNGLITLKGLVQPFDKNRLFLNNKEIPFQQSIDSLLDGRYSIKIIHPDFCEVEKTVDLLDPNPLKAILQTSKKGILEQGSNLVLVLNIDGGSQPYQIMWKSINSIDCDTCNQILLSVKKEELLSVLIKDLTGCDTTINYQLEIQGNGILFPNIINAGNGNENAVFNPLRYLSEEVIVNQFIIYDRWGNTIFSAKNLPRDWEGLNFAALDSSEGVYLFYLEFVENNRIEKVVKDFLLLR